MGDSEFERINEKFKVQVVKLDESPDSLAKSPLIVGVEEDQRPESSASGAETENNPQLTVSRIAYNLPTFNEHFEVQKQEKLKPSDVRNRALVKLRSCCTLSYTRKWLFSLIPILNWMTVYDVKKDLAADIIAGLTIVVFQVPQSMGYSLIAHVQPVYGLYTSFFPALVYAIMGTSRHCAVGTFAVVSLMTGTLVMQVNDERKATGKAEIASIDIAVAISLLTGVYQLLFGALRLGFVSVYMSEQLISGFTTAASLYVLTSQLSYLFGLKLPHGSGPLSLLKTYSDLFSRLDAIHMPTFCISVTCCIVLLIFKFWLNPKIQQKTGINVPFPVELLLVLLGTLASHFFKLKLNWNVDVIGKIPTGLPTPQVPHWSLLGDLSVRSIPLAVIAFTLTISVGKIFASRYKYNIDSNQELLALGATNTIGSFFSCIPSAASLSRSAVQEGAGGRTQLVSIVNSIGMLFVLLYAGPLLEQLPNCILASIIVVALKSLLLQVLDFRHYWQLSRVDGSIWIITFCAVLILDVDLGLYVGLCYSLITLIYKSQRPKMYLLGCVNNSDVFVPLKKYASAQEIPDIKIYQFCGPLHFANTEYFKEGLRRKTGVSVREILEMREKSKRQSKRRRVENKDRSSRSRSNSISSLTNSLDDENRELMLPTHIIIDCSMFSYIDAAGVGTLKATVQDYEYIGIKTYLASVATHVDRMLEKDNFYADVPPHHVYISIIDAVHHALDDQKILGSKKSVESATSNDDTAYSTTPLNDVDEKSLKNNLADPNGDPDTRFWKKE